MWGPPAPVPTANSQIRAYLCVMVNQAMYNPPGVDGTAANTGNGYSFRIGPGATTYQLSKVYGFNLHFLSRFGGCRDGADMFAEDLAQ